MATSSKTDLESILNDHDDGITCPVCRQLLKKPRYLFCHHCFCEECLEKEQVQCKITCPKCEGETIVPEEGIKELPKNFFITCMVDNLPKHMIKKSKYSKQLVKPEIVIRCSDHDEELLYYCDMYDQLVCKYCTVGQHAGHQHTSVAKKYQQELKKITVSLEEVVRNLSTNLDQIELVEHETAQRGDQVCMKIDQHFQEVVDSLTKQKEQLKLQALEMMSQVENDITPELCMKKKTLEVKIREVATVKKMCDVLIEGTLDQKTFAKKSLIDCIPQLVCLYRKCHIEPVQPAILEFVPAGTSSWPQLGQLCLTDPCRCEVVDLPGFAFKDCKTYITIIAKDTSGHCCFEGGCRVSVQLEEAKNSCMVDMQVRDNKDGSYVASIIPQEVGKAKLLIFVSGKQIKGSPYSITIRKSFTSIEQPSKIITIDNTGCEPWGIAYDKNNVWAVIDKNNSCVYVFNGENDCLNRLQHIPEAAPVGIAFGDNSMYVIDAASCQVLKFDKHHRCLRFGRNKISKAYNIVVHSGRVYVTDRAKKCVLVFTTDGDFHFNIGSGCLNTPRGLAVDVSNQLMFVADSHRGCIFTFTLDGLYIRKFGNKGVGVGQLSKPQGLASDSNGTVFVADSRNNCVSIFNKDGTFIHSFGHGHLKAPRSVALNPTGSIYVTDSKNCNIKVFSDY